MARDPTQFRARKRKYLRNQTGRGHGPVSEADRDAIAEGVQACDESKPTVPRPEWPDAPANIRGYRSETTLANWMYFLTRYARHVELTDCDARDVNQVAEDMLDGSSPHVKDGGLAKSSIRAYQNAARIFYRYHKDLGVAWSDVTVFDRTGSDGGRNSTFEPDDILTREEIEELQSVATDSRDAAVFNLLLYTGMRNRALRTLRVRDVDPQEGVFRFNPAEGTKDLHKPRAPRPLFGAKGPVADWLGKHPTPDDPDAYLITTNSKFTTPDPSEPVSDRTIERICDNLKEAAGVDKPLHPHMLRHNYVYICKRAYELPDDTIRFNLAHAPDSSIMEETYSHLSAEDHLEVSRRGAGELEGEADIGFELETCNVCNENLPEGAKACPNCGTVFTPDAKEAQESMQEQAEERIPEVQNETEAEIVQAVLEDLRENPQEYVEE